MRNQLKVKQGSRRFAWQTVRESGSEQGEVYRFGISSCSLRDVSGFWAPTSLFTLVVLCVTVFIAVSYTCFGHFKYLSPLNYEVSVLRPVRECTLMSLALKCHLIDVPGEGGGQGFNRGGKHNGTAVEMRRAQCQLLRGLFTLVNHRNYVF